MNTYLHLIILIAYAIGAAIVGLFMRTLPYGGLNMVPIMVGLGLFASIGILHLFFLWTETVQRSRRQLLVLTQEIRALRQTNPSNHNVQRKELVPSQQDSFIATQPQLKPMATAPTDTVTEPHNSYNDEHEEEYIPEFDEAIPEEQPQDKTDLKKMRNLVTQLYGRKLKDEPDQALDNEEDEPPRPRLFADSPNSTIPKPPSHAAPPRALRDLSEAEILTKVEQALEKERIELSLQPIVSLPGRHILFQECYARLKDEQGVTIGPEHYLAPAVNADLMPTIDDMLLQYLLTYLSQSANQQKNIGYFFNLSGQTIKNPNFFNQFLKLLEAMPGIGSRLIIELNQLDLNPEDTDLVKAITNLKKVGFRLSMDHVQQPDRAFQLAFDLSFDFIKVRAPRLMVYLDTDKQQTDQANQRLQQWRSSGLEVIAERIESEVSLKELMQYDIHFAQGYLFGPPEPV